MMAIRVENEVDEVSVVFDRIEPWQATYWRTLPLGHRVRYRARIELGGRNTNEVVAALHKWTGALDKKDPAYEHHLMEALWVHQSHNVVDDIEHVMKANTSPHLAEQKTGDRDFVTGTLADIINGRRSVDRTRPVIFSPFGLGILDLALGKWVYDEAVAAGQDVRLSDFFYEVAR